MGLVVLGSLLLASRVGWELWYQRHAAPSSLRWFHHGEMVAFSLALIFAGIGWNLLAGLALFAAFGIATAHIIAAFRRAHPRPR